MSCLRAAGTVAGETPGRPARTLPGPVPRTFTPGRGWRSAPGSAFSAWFGARMSAGR